MDIKTLLFTAVSQIPRGIVATYGQLAQLSGIKNARYVGYILHHNPNPKKFPCHRVVNTKGEVAKSYAFGGAESQKQKLVKEGVTFIGSHVNMRRHLWQGGKEQN